MQRQALLYVLLSILIVFFASYAYVLVVYVHTIFQYCSELLAPVFSAVGWGLLIRKILVLLLLPLLLAAIPALIYRALAGRDMPHFLALVWIIWVIIVLSNIIVR